MSHYNCSHSSHPYIFFNEDRESITFVGFKVNEDGELIDPRTRMEIEPDILSPTLYCALYANKVNFKEDYLEWNKHKKIEKLTTVMGCKPYDPDQTYVLTPDNLVKMLAIHMRFRYLNKPPVHDSHPTRSWMHADHE